MNENKTNINWYPGHIAKTRRQLKETINLIDVVYEVVDSRMPISSKINDIDEIINNKPRIIIATKYDLCDEDKTNNLLSRFKDQGYKVFPCNLNGNFDINKLLKLTKETCKDIMESRANKGLKKRKIRVLVVGIPNAGKSTLINRLVGRNSAKVGNKAGVTTNISWIRINDDIELLDSPGILSPKEQDNDRMIRLASLSSINENIVDKNLLSNFIIDFLINNYPDLLKNRYNLDELDFDTIYDDIAIKRGMLLKGGIPNYDRVVDTIVTDFKNGNFGKVTIDI